MNNITERTLEEIADQICGKFTPHDIVKIILYCDKEVSDYPFTFSVIKSLIHGTKQDDDFTQKEIQKMIKDAELVEL